MDPMGNDWEKHKSLSAWQKQNFFNAMEGFLFPMFLRILGALVAHQMCRDTDLESDILEVPKTKLKQS